MLALHILLVLICVLPPLVHSHPSLDSPHLPCLSSPPLHGWVYTYCHSTKTLTQSLSSVVHHSLGIYTTTTTTTTTPSSIDLHFSSGDPCSSSDGKPPAINRSAKVKLSCVDECVEGNRILSVVEPMTCVYVMEICAVALCQRGLFATTKATEWREDMGKEEKKAQLDRVRRIFEHSYDSYMKFAFPQDELKPLSCVGVNTDLTPGGMLTLIDAMDTLAVMGYVEEFKRVVDVVGKAESSMFAVDSKVSVFETTIRVMGGLLSAHLFCVDTELNFAPPGYDGVLLRMARDLGNRLMPAFNTTTKIPYGTVNLKYGVPYGETTEACTAAAGSLSLEFGMLSALTGDPQYVRAARTALKSVFDLRSNLNLLGRHVDVATGHWTEAIAGIGSNIDSIYEYYLKHYLLFADDEALEWFEVLYEGAIRHLRLPMELGARFYHETDMRTGKVVRRQFSALQAFWPGLQVLTGDVASATRSLNGFLAVWEETSFLPEDFDIVKWASLHGGSHAAYLLRPELIESVYYTHRATKDDSWLDAGRDMIDSMEKYSRVANCGFAAIANVDTKEKMDSMPSYFLSEWVKYMHLLFDEDNFLNKGNWVFSTEAHPFRITSQTQSISPHSFVSRDKTLRKAKFTSKVPIPFAPSVTQEDDVCLSFEPRSSSGTESYYKSLTSTQQASSSSSDSASKTLSEIQLQLRPFSGGAALPPNEDANPNEKRLVGFMDGVGTFEITSSSNGFIVHRVETNHRLVIANLDSTTAMITTNDGRMPVFTSLSRPGPHRGSRCVFELYANDACDSVLSSWWHAAALVGAKQNTTPAIEPSALVYSGSCAPGDGFGHPAWYDYTLNTKFPVSSFDADPRLCHTPTFTPDAESFILHASRGECSFENKGQTARALGASALIVSLLNPKDEPFVMAFSSNVTNEDGSMNEATLLSVPSFLLRHKAGAFVQSLHARGAKPQARVRVLDDGHVSTSADGYLTISMFREWQAICSPPNENGQYRLTVKKSDGV